MEFKTLNEVRQSVRTFSGEKVSQEILREILLEAQQAPSWKNSQTTRYYCVSSEEKVAEFRSSCLPEFNQNSTEKAAAFIVSTFVKNRSGFNREGVADNEVGNGWGAYDLGLHDMTLCLAAKDKGLDTLIMGLRDNEKIREMLGVSDDEEVMAVIAIGYGENPTKKPGRKELDSVAKFF